MEDNDIFINEKNNNSVKKESIEQDKESIQTNTVKDNINNEAEEIQKDKKKNSTDQDIQNKIKEDIMEKDKKSTENYINKEDILGNREITQNNIKNDNIEKKEIINENKEKRKESIQNDNENRGMEDKEEIKHNNIQEDIIEKEKNITSNSIDKMDNQNDTNNVMNIDNDCVNENCINNNNNKTNENKENNKTISIESSDELNISNIKNNINENENNKTFSSESFLNIKKLEYICRPTNQEFENPLNYIETLNMKLKENGACKIIPPNRWNPTQMNNFKDCNFIPKNKFFNKSKKDNCKSYNEKLIQYHEQKGFHLIKVPQIEKKPVNFEKLKNEIEKRNGYSAVCKEKKWAEIGRELVSRPSTSVSYNIKQTFIKWILPYEYHLKHLDDIVDPNKCYICNEEIKTLTKFLKCNCCEHLFHFDCIAKEESETLKNNDNIINSPLISNSVVNSQKMKTWVCTKCYDFVCQFSANDELSQNSKENEEIKDHFTLKSFESYANHFKEKYFSLKPEKARDTIKNINLNQMDIDQDQNENINNNINTTTTTTTTNNNNTDNDNNNTDNDNNNNDNNNNNNNNNTDNDNNTNNNNTIIIIIPIIIIMIIILII
eukprot:jgi/Orpsp1_1/1182338/evm.model.c7180000080875.1